MSEDNVDLLSGANPVDNTPSENVNPEVNVDQEQTSENEIDLSSLIKDEQLKNSDIIKKFKDVDSIVKSYGELQKKLGSRIQDLSPEDLKMLDKKFDVPESIEGYEFEEVKGNETVDNLRKLISEAGISKVQAEKFDKILRESIETEVKESDYKKQLSLEEGRKALESHYGFAYKDKLNTANQALHEIADQEQVEYFKQKGFTNDPEFIKALAKVGEIIGEDKLEFKSKSREFNMTPSDIVDQVNKMKKDYGMANIMKNPDLKKKFVHLMEMKAQYKNLKG